MIELLTILGGAAINGGFFYLIARSGAEERRRFLAAITAKDAGEYVAIERATAPRKTKKARVENTVRHPHGL